MTIRLDKALDHTGRVVLITGGTKGVGRGITERYLEAGAHVVVAARNEPDEIPNANNNSARFIAGDIRDVDHVAAVVAFATESFGSLDVLINNAGGSPRTDASTTSPRFSQSIIALNLMAPLNMSQAANAVMQLQPGGGSIVNIGSVSGLRPSPGTAAYGAAKAGLANLSQTLAVEWAPKVRVNVVTGGLIRTESAHLHYGDEDGIAAVSATIPMRRMGEPGDIADACLFLTSQLASFITGANIAVHGGGERPAFLDAGNAMS